ncbi:uncharacterized protein LOC18432763 isoform X3 [Amborella trichopoda]|uniref:uncharacterized protein LOC18432763 isoform X3 n=1 Tax=Amborella trichopoda TaxID=13333 RepID=UPI0009BCEFD0|nr:uncharacterized protein LOC18432763 isoform X3 [Amborella trichopoda]|eukprot:XP_020521989.1 uncharacterized protein LOC18432763 isoform X3 [Amborella trichopoda]
MDLHCFICVPFNHDYKRQAVDRNVDLTLQTSFSQRKLCGSMSYFSNGLLKIPHPDLKPNWRSSIWFEALSTVDFLRYRCNYCKDLGHRKFTYSKKKKTILTTIVDTSHLVNHYTAAQGTHYTTSTAPSRMTLTLEQLQYMLLQSHQTSK